MNSNPECVFFFLGGGGFVSQHLISPLMIALHLNLVSNCLYCEKLYKKMS
jgi:hypothetical protein